MIPYTLLVPVNLKEWEIRNVTGDRWVGLNLSFDPDQADFAPTNRTVEGTIELELPAELSHRLTEFLEKSGDPTELDVTEEAALKNQLAALIKKHQGED
jgi:hypothetical protein